MSWSLACVRFSLLSQDGSAARCGKFSSGACHPAVLCSFPILSSSSPDEKQDAAR